LARLARPAAHLPGLRLDQPRHLRDDDPASAADEHADFTRQHVTWHLEASGRARSLLVADTAEAANQPAGAVA